MRSWRDWGAPWDIVHPGVAIKQYPCCGSTHPAVDAMLLLVREHGSDAGDGGTRRFVDASTATGAHQPARSAERAGCQVQRAVLPGSRVCWIGACRWSISRTTASVIPAIRALLPRIHAAPHPDMSMASTEHFGAEVRATLTDGRVLTAKVARPLGRGPENPLPVELLEAKFLNCAARALPMEAAEGLLAVLRRVDTLVDMRQATDAMMAKSALAAE